MLTRCLLDMTNSGTGLLACSQTCKVLRPDDSHLTSLFFSAHSRRCLEAFGFAQIHEN